MSGGVETTLLYHSQGICPFGVSEIRICLVQDPHISKKPQWKLEI
jgi:hypothetical protein